MRLLRAPGEGHRGERAEREPGPGGEDSLLSAGRPVTALVLRKYDYSETSQILRILTRESGVLSVLAKGSKKEKSSFGGPLDIFYRGPATVVFRRSGLHILAQFRVEDSGAALRAELYRYYGACHVAEILIGLTREEEPFPALYDRTVAGLDALAGAGESEADGVLAATELGLLAEVGFAPALGACVACDREAPAAMTLLSAAAGGVLCPDCRGRDPRARRTKAPVLNALRALARTPPDRAGRIRLPPGDARAVRAFLTAFVEWRLERPLRTARFL